MILNPLKVENNQQSRKILWGCALLPCSSPAAELPARGPVARKALMFAAAFLHPGSSPDLQGTRLAEPWPAHPSAVQGLERAGSGCGGTRGGGGLVRVGKLGAQSQLLKSFLGVNTHRFLFKPEADRCMRCGPFLAVLCTAGGDRAAVSSLFK